MAQFPYLYQTGFETGAVDTGVTLSDASSKSAYMHYTDMVGRHNITPWRGAYSWVINQSVGTAAHDCHITVAGANFDANNYWSVGFAFLAKSTTMTNGDRTSLLQIEATGTDESVLQLYYTTAAGLKLLLTETAATAVGSNPSVTLTENVWHWIELHGKVDDGGSNNGTTSFRLDGELVGTISSLDQGAITNLIIGLDDIDAGHTAGIYAIDDLLISGIATTAVRIGHRNRYPWNPHVSATASSTYGEHLFVGPGTLDSVSLLTANAGDVIRVFDTDTGSTTGDYVAIAEANYSSGMPVTTDPIKLERGCFVQITGAGASGARGIVNIAHNPSCGFPATRCYQNDANLKYLSAYRGRRPGNN